nr:ubiquitin carboxyl-terminal hydrolase 18-like [Ipomoea batatas]
MSVSADLNLTWVLQFIATVFLIALALLHLLKNTASKYFVVDASFDSTAAAHHRKMEVLDDGCIVCRSPASKHCSRCKMVKYCSETCQRSHWKSEHKLKCIDSRPTCKDKLVLATSTSRRRKTSVVSLVPASGSSKILNQSRKILFPYEEFVQLFNWDKPGFPPCGLLNCGNSCFANVVLQCLVYTKPLIAYILEKGHARECKRNDWCFFCEFERHVERARQSSQPFSPINILSRLPSLGGNLGYGKQEDAHEFMRFAIDTMQLVCLDEFGGEKAVHPNSQETTLIQHIFGGRLQSQVICTQCKNISNQYENMMDLNVEIHGDVASLEECLDQFTAKESLHGDNMYKCDRCNDYVGAWKRLMICRAPNILTIALKRFQRGRFGKLNKRVTFPETLDLRPYTSESSESDDVYRLYAVIVHVDMLNASFFGHYICYIKDFCGRWYRIDDCKVASVDLDEVLSQGAYMLLYSRISARPTSLYPVENLKNEKQDVVQVEEVQPCLNNHVESATAESLDPPLDSGLLSTDKSLDTKTDIAKEEVYPQSNFEVSMEEKVDSEASQSDTKEFQENGRSFAAEETATSAERAQSLVSSVQPVISGVDTEAGINQASSDADLLRNSTKDSQTDSHGNGEIQCDVSSSISSRGEILENGANSTVKHDDKVNHSNGAHGIQDGLNKSDGGPEKLKPLLSPGFLGKRPRNKCVKQGAKVADEVSKLTLHDGPNGQSNGCLNNPNCESNHVEKPCIENNSSAIVNKQDGNGHLQSRELSSLCNEDSGLPQRS